MRDKCVKVDLEPFVAVVIDPIRTMATNKINIESFRTYPDGYKPSIQDEQEFVISTECFQMLVTFLDELAAYTQSTHLILVQ